MVAPKVTEVPSPPMAVSGSLSALHPVRVASVAVSIAVSVAAVASHRRMLCRRMAFGRVWLCIFMFSYAFISCS